MHISDGILNPETCIVSAAAAVLIMSYSVKKTEVNNIPRVSVMTAAFFAASLLHVKLGPASTHLLLNGIVGIVLGISSIIAVVIALLFQAIMFQHGGITTLGVNAIAMGLPAIIAWGIFRIQKLIKSKKNIAVPLLGFVAGVLSVALSALFISMFLVFSGKEFTESARLILLVHAPLAVIEGIVTLFTVSFLYKVKPEILGV